MSSPSIFDGVKPRPPLARDEREAQRHELRGRLLDAQARLHRAGFSVVVLFAGVDGGGKSETVGKLGSWLDQRGIRTRAYGAPSDEERGRPAHWRFWRDLPARGSMGVFLSAWYSAPLLRRVYGESDDAALDAELEQIVELERMLALDGTLVVKVWLHLGRDEQRARFEALEQDPLESWRVTDKDWEHWRLYERFESVADRIVRRTEEPVPWHVIEASDPSRRTLDVARVLAEAIEERLEEAANDDDPGVPARPQGSAVAIDQGAALAAVDLDTTLEKGEYRRRLAELQGRLAGLQRAARRAGIAVVQVFEGWDAAGKGGAIRRLTAALDPRDYDVVQIAAPTDEELARHYLWRFWRQLPRRGRTTIFDRSWYGRVLVERVEGFAREDEWRRAFDEINEFERQLVDSGMILQKFWLHISQEEQKRRFLARRELPHKRWKLTEEDWRNRDRWAEYEVAVEEMIERTSTPAAPWRIVPAEDKRLARILVLEAACEDVASALGRR